MGFNHKYSKGIFSALITSIPISSSVKVENKNFQARYKYGNKQKSGLKLSHWNKGPAFLENRIDEIETIISKFSPHIFGISESNFKNNHDVENVKIDDYEVFFAKKHFNSFFDWHSKMMITRITDIKIFIHIFMVHYISAIRAILP